MKDRLRTLELLAPARDADIGIEAINHGADAVYIGGPGFGARAAAGNPVADIERLVRHAHRFGARIFVTMNTILRDDELEPVRSLAWDVYRAGADAMIVQDMGLLEIDLPPIQLHASTQCDIRTPEKARFLAQCGFSQLVAARELDLAQIRAVAQALPPDTVLEFFVHGALCVAYSGQCYVSHAQTGRSANRGDCSQACRLPYTVTDHDGRILAHDKHVLSLKDNDQSANLAALIEAGVRSFKIEGRYKDLGYVKNITGHYRRLLDTWMEGRSGWRSASSGRTELHFNPDPSRNFNRGATDYFLNGRQDDIGAFDTPKHAGLSLGWVRSVQQGHVEVELDPGVGAVNNGDSITWFDRQGELQGVQVNTADALDAAMTRFRLALKEPPSALKDLRENTLLYRNRDMAWERQLRKPSSVRRIGVSLHLEDTAEGLALSLTDEDGHFVRREVAVTKSDARQPDVAMASIRDGLARLGGTIFEATEITLALEHACFIPASDINALRRAGLQALEEERRACWQPLPRKLATDPPAPYPDGAVSYLANVYNQKAHDFYARHGVAVIDAAYESHEAVDDVSLMITKHCIRYALSLCPKQAKGVTGVQGTIRAEPLQIRHGEETLTLRFDCKACEMHVVGRIKRQVLRRTRESERNSLKSDGAPIQVYRRRPVPPTDSGIKRPRGGRDG